MSAQADAWDEGWIVGASALTDGYKSGQPNPYRDDTAPAMRWEYTIAWDGEPKMGGGNHRQQMGTFHNVDEARAAFKLVESRSKHAPKPNLRIERRQVTEWVEAFGECKGCGKASCQSPVACASSL